MHIAKSISKMNLNFNGTVNFHNSVNLSTNTSDESQYQKRVRDAAYNMQHFDRSVDLSLQDNVQDASTNNVSNVNEVSPPLSNTLPNPNVSEVTPESLYHTHMDTRNLYTKRGKLRSKRGRPRAIDAFNEAMKRQNVNRDNVPDIYQETGASAEPENDAKSQDSFGGVDWEALDDVIAFDQ